MPRSTDEGRTWSPTIPIEHDVHEVQAHPCRAEVVAAAAAAGLCVSHDAGRTWAVLAEGLSKPSYCLSVAWLDDEVLFSHEDGPFAKRSQIWRWRLSGGALEQVRDGLPEFLTGKVDSHCMAAAGGRAAVLDRGGTLWCSTSGSKGWKPIATSVSGAFGVLAI